jgi:capsular polysaccharide biosynthesis protein
VGTALQAVGYDELCAPTGLAKLPYADGDAIAHIAPALTEYPRRPVDLGGVLGSNPAIPTDLPRPARRPETWWTAPMRSPPLYAASLRDVVCFGGLPHGDHDSGQTLLAHGRLVVPDSYFVREVRRSLPSKLIEQDDRQGGLRMKVDTSSFARRSGVHYFAGAAWEHFGHFLLEGLSRWWLLRHLPEAVRSELRIVLYNDRPLRRWQLELLDGLGVREDRLLYLTEPLRFECLIVPSIAYNLHTAAAGAQYDTWERIGRAFDRPGGPERVYLSRSRYPHRRRLTNEAEVERLFQARGFTVIHPHELSVSEQIGSVRHARMLAGSAGSAMYLAAFAKPGVHKMIISPHCFAFRDDQLISHLRDESLTYFLCSQEREPENPRMTDYEVALDTLELAIDRWTDGVAGSRAQAAVMTSSISRSE